MSNTFRDIENLTETLVQDLLQATDDQILEEAAQDGTDINAAVALVRSSFEKARFEVSKSILKCKNRNTADYRTQSSRVDMAMARKKVIDAILANPDFNSGFTLAARSGKGIPDDDVIGLYEDMVDLGLIDQECVGGEDDD